MVSKKKSNKVSMDKHGRIGLTLRQVAHLHNEIGLELGILFFRRQAKVSQKPIALLGR
jgi:hypothetical protein